MAPDIPTRLHAFSLRMGREIADNAGTAIKLALVSLLPLLPFVFQFDDSGLRLVSRSAALIAAGLVLVALLSRWIYFTFALAYVPLTIVAVHIVRHFGGEERGWRLDQPDARVETFLESPGDETLEFLQTQLWPSDWALLVLSVLFLVVLGYVFYTRKGLSPSARVAVALALAACAALLIAQREKDVLDEWPQYQLAFAAYEAGKRREMLAARTTFLSQNPLPAADCTHRYRKVVVVIGESASTDHMSAFGYRRETTPFIRKSAPFAIEALAPSNLTRFALPMMLTGVRPGHFEDFYQLPSLVSQLRACGYETLWISNQGRVGRQDSFVASIAREADREVFLNELSYKDSRHDGYVLEELERLGIYRMHNQATFIHLIGSHMRYDRRYPPGFGFAKIDGTVDAYDNSILFTDFVLSQLHERFGSEGVLLAYASDHAEIVTEQMHGHGFTRGYQEEYQVPLLVWGAGDEAIGRVKADLGASRLNLESFDSLINFLVGNSNAPRLSTSDVVSSLSGDNAVRFEDLRRFRPQVSKSGQ